MSPSDSTSSETSLPNDVKVALEGAIPALSREYGDNFRHDGVLRDISRQELREDTRINPSDEPRAVISMARDAANAVANARNEATSFREKIQRTEQDLERLQISQNLGDLTNKTERKERLVNKITDLLQKNPEIVPDIAQHDLGAPARDALAAAKEQIDALHNENSALRQRLADIETDYQILRNQPYGRTQELDEQSVSTSLGITRTVIQSLFLVPCDLEATIDWDGLDTACDPALRLARHWADDQIQPNAHLWLSRLPRLVRVDNSPRSAQEVAVRLFVQAFMTRTTVSLVDITTLAGKMRGLEPQELKLPLAFLHFFLTHKSDEALLEDAQFSEARALILLRGIELFIDHISGILELQKIAQTFAEIKAYLREACKRSFIVNGLTLYLDAFFSGRKPEPLTNKIITSAGENTITTDNRLMSMDGDNVITCADGSVTIYRP